MNSAMVYLLSRRLKNSILSLIRKPAAFIYTLLMLALFAFTLYTGAMSESHAETLRPIEELCSIVTAFYTLMFLLVLNNGFGDGASVFKLADVNLLFTSPTHPAQVLNYGLFQQMSSSLLMGFFVLFQYTWMRVSYGVRLPELFLMLLGYSVTIFAAQFAAMALYTTINGDEKRRKLARAVYVALPSAYALWIFASAASNAENVTATLASAGVSLAVRLFPVSGWAGGIIAGVLMGKFSFVVIGIVLSAALILGLTAFIRHSNPEYYEDVISPAETAHTTRESAKSGRLRESAPKKLRLGRGTIQGGGAQVFYYKHRIENSRSRIFLFDGTTLLFAALTVGISFFMRGAGLLPIAVYAAYMQFFTVALGRFIKELTKPFIYLMPEPPFKKLLWAMVEGIPGFFAEALLVFVPVCLMLKLGPLETAACVLMRVSYSMLFLSANLVVERVFGTVTVKALIMLFYMLTVLLLMLPGIVLAVLLYTSGFIPVSFEFSVCISLVTANLPVALLCVFLCRNILDNAEINT